MMNESLLIFSVATLASLRSTLPVTSPDYSAHTSLHGLSIIKSTAIKAPLLYLHTLCH